MVHSNTIVPPVLYDTIVVGVVIEKLYASVIDGSINSDKKYVNRLIIKYSQ